MISSGGNGILMIVNESWGYRLDKKIIVILQPESE